MISEDKKIELQNKRKDLQQEIMRYNRIQRRDRQLIYYIGFYLLLFVIIIVVYATVLEESLLLTVAMVSYLAIYLLFMPFILRRQTKRKLGERSHDATFYAAVSAAERLESGRLIEASFCADKMLEALSYLTEYERVEVEPWKSSLKSLLYIMPSNVQRKAVLQAIQESSMERSEFVERFYALASGLSTETADSLHIAIKDFLSWFSVKYTPYEGPPLTFWHQHLNVRIILDIAVVVAPVIVIIVQVFI